MSDDSCLFCRIVRGEIPAERIFENDEVLAFPDINPVAPKHFLVIPKVHRRSLNAIEAGDTLALGKLFEAAKAVADQEGFAEQGFRCVVNTEAAAGQSVFHIHLHVIAGRALSWPPG